MIRLLEWIWKTKTVIFSYAVPGQELTKLEQEDLREFPILSDIKGDDPDPISHDYDRGSS